MGSIVVLIALGATATSASAEDPPRSPSRLTELLDMNAENVRGNGRGTRPTLSEEGRFAAFTSFASNLVEGDTNKRDDIFLRDRKTGSVERVSVSNRERQSNDASEDGSISGTGRYVAFSSYATNLVRNDPNGYLDVFVRDRERGTTDLVSVSSSGRRGNGESSGGVVSANGRYVTFTSDATNLVPNDTNGRRDVFVRNLVSGKTKRVSVSSGGRQANGGPIDISPGISGTGQFVTFDSSATNLVSGDGNGKVDVFVHDLLSGRTRRVKGVGDEANDHSFNPAISSDGRYISYNSHASNVVSGDTNEVMDVFVYDSLRRSTERVSVTSEGNQGVGNRNPDDMGTYGHSGWSTISADGRYVAFDSSALNLETDDTNASIDVFVHDRRTKTTTRASVSSSGGEVFGWSTGASISSDGRWLAFSSESGDLAPEDPDFGSNTFVHGPLW